MLIADVSNSSLWEPVYNISLVATKTGNANNYYPIPVTNVPILFDSKIVAISATSQKNQNRKFAGYVNQKVVTGITVAGLPDAEVSSRRLYLNKINLYVFQKLTSTYSLSVYVPYWFEDIALNFWQFTGTVDDTTEQLIQLTRDTNLNRIEQKVDNLPH